MDSLAEGLFPPQSAGLLRSIPPEEWGPEHRDRPQNFPVLEERWHVEASVVAFDAGGFELVVRTVDMQERIDRGMGESVCARRPGQRKPFDQRSEDDWERSAWRAKRRVRLLARQLGVQYLNTLTTREASNTPESLAAKWKRFLRDYRRVTGCGFDAVAVPEPHPKNPDHWHLHFATPARVDVNAARVIWWNVCGGRGMGNIDCQYVKVPGGHAGEKSRRIASYIAKYMTKALVARRHDKKRYWHTDFDMPDVRRVLLRSRPGQWRAIVEELQERFGAVVWENRRDRSWYFFPDHSGLWYSHIAGHPRQAPPPF